MGKLHPTIPSSTIPWLKSQHMFWVATAPLSSSGHVNVSPKCTEGTFHIVDETRVWYEDLTGSSVETISHLREPDNGRISILFHAFEGSPMIVRIYGKGMVYEYGTSEYEGFLSSVRDREDKNEVIRRPGSRAIIIVDIIQVMTTCGWAVPNYDFKSYRTKLHDWAEGLESHDTSPPQQQGSQVENGDIAIHKDGMKSWWLTRNSKSLDGLPALHTAFEVEGSLASTRSYPGQQFPHLLLPKDSTSKKTSLMSNLEFCIGLGIGICLGITLSTLPVSSHFPFRV